MRAQLHCRPHNEPACSLNGVATPPLVVAASECSGFRFLEFFASAIRNAPPTAPITLDRAAHDASVIAPFPGIAHWERPTLMADGGREAGVRFTLLDHRAM